MEPRTLGKVMITKASGKGPVRDCPRTISDQVLQSAYAVCFIRLLHEVPLHAQGGSMELLLPSAGNGGQEKSFTLRETTDNSTPSFMFAHLAGRLSECWPPAIQPHMCCHHQKGGTIRLSPQRLLTSLSFWYFTLCTAFQGEARRSCRAQMRFPVQVWRGR